jgi:hypothetical protein
LVAKMDKSPKKLNTVIMECHKLKMRGMQAGRILQQKTSSTSSSSSSSSPPPPPPPPPPLLLLTGMLDPKRD